jgi:Fe-S-cluster-containing dehydrogenase component/CRP-like cAMP-binding protein
MAEVLTINKPDRWDVPFSREMLDPQQRRDMRQAEVDELLATEPFASMDSDNFPRRLPLEGIIANDTRIRHFDPGDVIVRQGDYGNSAFLVLDGDTKVVLQGLDPERIGRRRTRRKSMVADLFQKLTNPRSPESRDARDYPQMGGDAGTSRSAVFVQDVTNALEVMDELESDSANVTLGEGQLFGELAALGRMPRTATVLAGKQGARLLEIRWQGLRELRKYDEALRRHVDEQFRKYGLSAALRASPLLSNLTRDEQRQVADAAEFETFGTFDWHGTYQQLRERDVDPRLKEPVVAREGEYVDGLILVSAGFVRLSRQRGHGEHTFSYLGKADIYGLAELAHNATYQQVVPYAATLRAIGHADIVRIPTQVVEKLILPRIPDELIPQLPASVGLGESESSSMPSSEEAEVTLPLAGQPSTGTEQSEQAERIDPAMMEFLVENRYINGTATMMIDLDRCTRCDECVKACADGHDNNPRFIRHGKVIGHHMVANACMHCEDPVCMIGCPTGAIHRDEQSGEVVINDKTCIGCGLCAASCPYDNIRMVEVRDRSNDDAVMVDPNKGEPILKASKCDLCADHVGGPACQRACPHDALKRVDMRDKAALAEYLNRL